ncbi:uncharacterized protein B0H18DRAFT_1090759 [Fomitopsis serialis]|uniref:uncharacterized protein n=1 Tax=Fomitopsis serialis TaxID=139415 RepID=UPI002007A957|nr:uncharacterized protein B0H18DRAFT_1090759 [Neoantrodia serialis]KAH9906581.1 hypothetical protein B0H18DRAFT_1090759 [Neoantrodia serialis]
MQSSKKTVTEVSRPHSQWKEKRTGSRGGAKEERHVRTNWYHPFLWLHIDKAARKVGWGAEAIAKELHRTMPELYGRLRRQTVHRWFAPGGFDWSETTKKNVERYHALTGSGRVGILSNHPDIVDEMKTALKELRTAGVAVNVVIGCSILLAIIKERKPELLEKFKCSEVRQVVCPPICSSQCVS